MKKILIMILVLSMVNIVASESKFLAKINGVSSGIVIAGLDVESDVIEGEKVYETCADGKRVVADKAELLEMINANEDVTDVCTKLVTDMSELFKNNTAFNQDISD